MLCFFTLHGRRNLKRPEITQILCGTQRRFRFIVLLHISENSLRFIIIGQKHVFILHKRPHGILNSHSRPTFFHIRAMLVVTAQNRIIGKEIPFGQCRQTVGLLHTIVGAVNVPDIHMLLIGGGNIHRLHTGGSVLDGIHPRHGQPVRHAGHAHCAAKQEYRRTRNNTTPTQPAGDTSVLPNSQQHHSKQRGGKYRFHHPLGQVPHPEQAQTDHKASGACAQNCNAAPPVPQQEQNSSHQAKAQKALYLKRQFHQKRNYLTRNKLCGGRFFRPQIRQPVHPVCIEELRVCKTLVFHAPVVVFRESGAFQRPLVFLPATGGIIHKGRAVVAEGFERRPFRLAPEGQLGPLRYRSDQHAADQRHNPPAIFHHAGQSCLPVR